MCTLVAFVFFRCFWFFVSILTWQLWSTVRTFILSDNTPTVCPRSILFIYSFFIIHESLFIWNFARIKCDRRAVVQNTRSSHCPWWDRSRNDQNDWISEMTRQAWKKRITLYSLDTLKSLKNYKVYNFFFNYRTIFYFIFLQIKKCWHNISSIYTLLYILHNVQYNKIMFIYRLKHNWVKKKYV